MFKKLLSSLFPPKGAGDVPPQPREAGPGQAEGSPDPDIARLRGEIAEMSSQLFATIGIPFEKTSELQRQLLGAFAFGMVFAVGQIEKLSPAQVHALVLSMLMDVFRYSDHQAAAFAEQLITVSSDKKVHPTIHAIIHRGIDGHFQWQQNQTSALRDNIQHVFNAVHP